MPPLAQRVDVLEDRLDRVERLMQQAAERSDRFDERMARDREEWDRRTQRIDRRREADREEWKQQREADREEWKQQREADREEWKQQREADREEWKQQREEWARERRAMNKQWSDLAAKMGTVVEDIVAPSVRRMARELFDCGEELLFTSRIDRVRSDDRSRRREFDVLYVGDRALLLNETKSSPRGADVRRFVRLVRSGEFFLYFPEYRDLPIVPVFSSLSLPDNLVTQLTRNGVYALAMGDEAMQVLNLDAVRGRPAGARP